MSERWWETKQLRDIMGNVSTIFSRNQQTSLHIKNALSNTIPNEQQFVSIFSQELDESLDKEKPGTRNILAQLIYNVLFLKTVSQLTESEKQLLSTLFTSEEESQSIGIFKRILELFPETTNYMNTLVRYKEQIDFVPWKQQEIQQEIFFDDNDKALERRKFSIEYFIKHKPYEKNLLEVLGNEKQSPKEVADILNVCFKGHIKNTSFQNISNDDLTYLHWNFFNEISFLSYDVFSWTLIISACSEKAYHICDDKYIRIILSFFQQRWLPVNIKKLSYRIPSPTPQKPSPNISNSPKVIEKPKNLERNHLHVLHQLSLAQDPHFSKENYLGNDFSPIFQHLKEGKNIYLYGEGWSGKSHLVQALIKELITKENFHILYTNGDLLYNIYQKGLEADRTNKDKRGWISKTTTFLDALSHLNLLIIDDYDDLSHGSKVATQDMLNKLIKRNQIQLVCTGKKIPIETKWNYKTSLKEGGNDYIPTTLVEQFHSNAFPLKQQINKDNQKIMLQNIWNSKHKPSLFVSQESIAKVIQFILDSNISPSIYTILIENIASNLEVFLSNHPSPNEEEIAGYIYQIIRDNTGKKILPSHDVILESIIDMFHTDEVLEHIKLPWVPLDKKEFMGKNRHPADSWEGIILRTYVYFIKRYYPFENFSRIDEIIKKSWSSTLYKESKEWFSSNGKVVASLIEEDIKRQLYKKYGISFHNI